MSIEKQKNNLNMEIIKEALLNYIIPIVCILGSVLLGVFVFLPAYKGLPKLKTDLESSMTLKATLNSKLLNLNKLVDYKSVVDENSKLVNTLLVSESLIPALLTQVDRIARDSGLEITRLGYGAGGGGTDTTAENYSEVVVSLSVSGSYAQLQQFLLEVEKAARLLNIKDLRFSFQERIDATKLTIDVVISSPYLFVESNAVTDEQVNLDISSPDFVKFINKIKTFKYYNPYEVNLVVPVVEDTTPAEDGASVEGASVNGGTSAAGATPNPSPTATPTPTPTSTPVPTP